MLRTSVDNFGDSWGNSNSAELFWSCMELVVWGQQSQYVVPIFALNPTYGLGLAVVARGVDKFPDGFSQIVP